MKNLTNRLIKKSILRVLMVLLLLHCSQGLADSPVCTSADMWGEALVSDICWSCLFPAKLFGASTGDLPDGATEDIVCTCFDPLGVPEFGFTQGFWQPSRLIELVKTPYCSPSLGGIVLKEGSMLIGNTNKETNDVEDLNYYNYHYFSFPLYAMLDLMISADCGSDGYLDLDLMYLSEIDPTWNDDELALLTNPEAGIFASLPAQAACVVDCAAASMDSPINSMYWCAGCWGGLYPFSGHISGASSPPKDTSLLATKAIASLHRRGLARKTMGTDALCEAEIFPTIPKQQYKMSMIHPVPEAGEDCCHVIGKSTFQWGEHRNIPGTGEDMVYVLWNYSECCAR